MLTFYQCCRSCLFVFYVFLWATGLMPSALQQTVENCSTQGALAGIIAAFQAIFILMMAGTPQLFHRRKQRSAKTMPKSMIIGVLSIIAIYLLVNGAILYVVPVSQLAGTKLACSHGYGTLVWAWDDTVRYRFFLISVWVSSTLSRCLHQGSFIPWAGINLFIPAATWVNKTGTPWLALILTTPVYAPDSIGQGYLWQTFGYCHLLFFVLSYTAGFVSLIRLRGLNRIYRALIKCRYIPFTHFINYTLVVVSAGAVYSDLNSSKYGLIFGGIVPSLFGCKIPQPIKINRITLGCWWISPAIDRRYKFAHVSFFLWWSPSQW